MRNRIFYLYFLSIWIFSFTICIDVFNELKLFDILSLFAIYLYRKVIFRRLFVSSLEKSLFFLFIAFTYGFFVSFIYSAHTNVFLYSSFLRLFRVFAYISIFFVIHRLILSHKNLLFLLYTVILALSLQSLLIIGQYFDYIPILWPEEDWRSSMELTGTLGTNHVNNVLFMLVGLYSCMHLFFSLRSNIFFRVLIISFMPCSMFLAMLIGEARASFLAISTFIISLLFSRRAVICIIILIVSLVLYIYIFEFNILEYTGSSFSKNWRSLADTGDSLDYDDFDTDRFEVWKKTNNCLLNNPHYILFGVGFNNYRHLECGASSGHNLFYQVIVELGIPGLFAYLTFFVGLFKNCFASFRSKLEFVSLNGYIGTSCLIGVLSIGFVQRPFYPTSSIPGFMGFILAFYSILLHKGWSENSHTYPRRHTCPKTVFEITENL